ncbi:YjcZ family sporulation protein [Lederbergia panacisoli]|uniref:YjcZ family sporulation protein n=1 Tax=Lederbergia panacisoli TaxID=1255251 RepID=UPI0027D8CCE8|nr:YjcZ family sporulation protein [Lederbergia panacisoli]
MYGGYGGYGYDGCCPSYPMYGGCGYGGGFVGGNGFALIVVLFILLIIIGACWAFPN